MTVSAEATRTVPASCQQVLELVLDLDRYRQADHKIRRVGRPVELDDDGRGTARYWGRLKGTPPAPDVNLVYLRRWSELTFTSAPRQPARLLVFFVGRFTCREIDGGCEVTHGYEITFRRPFRWIYEPLLDGWLQAELDAELDRMHDMFAALG